MIELAEVARRVQAAHGRIPLLTLDEFFDGNAEEESIAPTQVGYGRPDLAEIHRRLALLEADSDVAWIRVELHHDMSGLTTDTIEDDYDGVAAESIAICTSASTHDLETRLGADDLQSDVVIEGLSYDRDRFCDIPPIPDGFRVTTLVWD